MGQVTIGVLHNAPESYAKQPTANLILELTEIDFQCTLMINRTFQ